MYADLLRSAKLASLGEMATGLAHEINTPLATIGAEQTNLADLTREQQLDSEVRQSMLKSIERYGRTHKLEIMLRYKLQKRDWFSDLDVGLKMLAKRKLDLTPSRVRQVNQVKGLFNQDHRQETEGAKAGK